MATPGKLYVLTKPKKPWGPDLGGSVGFYKAKYQVDAADGSCWTPEWSRRLPFDIPYGEVVLVTHVNPGLVIFLYEEKYMYSVSDFFTDFLRRARRKKEW